MCKTLLGISSRVIVQQNGNPFSPIRSFKVGPPVRPMLTRSTRYPHVPLYGHQNYNEASLCNIRYPKVSAASKLPHLCYKSWIHRQSTVSGNEPSFVAISWWLNTRARCPAPYRQRRGINHDYRSEATEKNIYKALPGSRCYRFEVEQGLQKKISMLL